MSTVYISLGGDLGDPVEQQEIAIQRITELIGPVQCRSSFYRTEPWGVDRRSPFINSALRVSTKLDPFQLLGVVLRIEQEMGRVRDGAQYAQRSIDLDILYYNDLILNTSDLQVPHPRLHLRRFVLEPMNEIAPGLIDPLRRRSISELLRTCSDTSYVEKLECVTTT